MFVFVFYTWVYFTGVGNYGIVLFILSTFFLLFIWLIPILVLLIFIFPGYVEITNGTLIIKKTCLSVKLVFEMNDIKEIIMYASHFRNIITKENKRISIFEYLDKRDEFLKELGDRVKVVHYPIFDKKLDRKMLKNLE